MREVPLYARGSMVALGGGAVSYERGTPVQSSAPQHALPPPTPKFNSHLQGYRAHKKTPPPTTLKKAYV